MQLYKLTNEKGQTRNNTQWGPNVTHTATGRTSQPLCSDGWIHAYTSPLLAVLLNPIHANFSNPQLWEAEGEIGKTDKGLKEGVRSLTTIRQIPLPKVTVTHHIAFGILCTMVVYKEPKFIEWAHNWLSGKDRSRANATYAANTTYAANAAAYAANATYAAAYAANAAAYAANATYAAAYAANAAAYAAAFPLNLADLAEKAMAY